jgi:hypothetical protein
MKILEVAVKDLQHFLSSPIYNNLKVIPLTPERMLSQLNNPRARADDIVLIVAITDENILAGFIGMLPDKAFGADKTYRFAWNSCWWADPVHGKGIALQLFFKSIHAWKGNYMITDLTEYTRNIVKQTGLFYFTEPKNGVCLKIRSDLALYFQGRNRKWRMLLRLLNLIDWLINGLIKLRLNKWKRKTNGVDIAIQYIPSFDKSDIDFISKMNGNELCRREKTEFEWITTYPWLTHEKGQEWKGKSYPFSWLCRQFKIEYIRFLYNTEIIGLALLTCRDGVYRIPYAYFNHHFEIPCYSSLCRIFIENKATGILTFREGLVKYLINSKFPAIRKKVVIKDLAISKSLSPYHPEHYILQDGDGDVVFT